MSIYELPETKKNEQNKDIFKNTWNILLLVFALLISIFLGLNIGKAFILDSQASGNDANVLQSESINVVKDEYIIQTEQENMVISAVEKSMSSVVSIIIKKTSGEIYDEYLKDDPFENFFKNLIPDYGELNLPKDKNALKQIGAGTGFIVSENGLIVTNKHVIEDDKAVYSILTNEGEAYDVEILSKNPVQDIAILKIKNTEDKNFEALRLGNSSSLKLGQSVIAIGNALGEFQNSVSVGVVSGLQRNVLAQGNGTFESLEDIIQTDAAINRGNSGGPLLNLRGEVIGINTAVSMGGENIGFAIPINKAKRDLEQVLNQGRIAYPFVGIRYVIIDEEYASDQDLSVNYGALIVKSKKGEDSSIIPNSPAEKAGLREEDIILELDEQKISKNNTLTKIIQNYFPGDKVTLKFLRNEQEFSTVITLGDWNDF
ncbi:MAG: trypsin-like peptidase domain-containing protein [Candidatus Pacebacteria bacterium]|nr:trypsin-like peptidase domain-containing protein [Candidatus Paceibacterota bacterium]